MTGTTPERVFAVDGLRVSYGDTEILRGVDLMLAPGEKVGVVGESGSGKSTLALAVLGLLGAGGRITSGRVSVLGRDVTGLSDRELDRVRGRDLSLVFQDPLTSLDPVKTIGSQIGEALRRHNRGMSKRDVAKRSVELLSSVGVSAPERRLAQYPHEFSGGMRQRVLIAIAIANDPAVLIADEPTTALDVTTQAQVMEVLEDLVASRGISVVLITHDLGVVAEFCDRVCVMYAGRIVESAGAAELFDRPAHPYSRALLASLALPGRSRSEPLEWIPGAPPAMTSLPPGCAFAPRCAMAEPRCAEAIPEPEAVFAAGGSPRWAECLRAGEVYDTHNGRVGADHGA
ncbi:ABC transporter ATP-binding protein [Saccharomonospora sp. NPDC046836]|uniref:ABC transporter ATP-binding protein n=1 Tax=Saccharomonospora sp. NPDC046836 TaxID=3156921 RepID=UPI0033C7DC00